MISRVFQVHSNIAEPELGIRSVTISLWKYIKYDANLAPDVVLVPVFWYILSILFDATVSLFKVHESE